MFSGRTARIFLVWRLKSCVGSWSITPDRVSMTSEVGVCARYRGRGQPSRMKGAKFSSRSTKPGRLSCAGRPQSEVVELRYFGGLSVDETAEALGVSSITVIRQWNFAKAWRLRELAGAGHSIDEPERLHRSKLFTMMRWLSSSPRGLRFSSGCAPATANYGVNWNRFCRLEPSPIWAGMRWN